MNIKIKNTSNNDLPKYETQFSSGLDLKAFSSDNITLKSNDISLIKTGLFIEIPEGFEAQIRPRSGLALKYGITILNSPGTIDSDYRGEIGVILVNLSKNDFVIKNGDRIAQIVFSKFEKINWFNVNDLSHTNRGSGGFGSTGNK